MATQQTQTTSSIFEPLGALSTYTYPSTEGEAFFTLAPVNTQGSQRSYLTGAMPITGLHIQEGVDFSITKALDQDFFIAAFGDSPVTIIMRGISFDKVPTCLPTPQGQSSKQDRAMEFYDKYKLSTDINNRVDIGISTTDISYRCALIAMEAQKSGEGAGSQSVYSYTMKLIGARKKKK